MPVESFYSPYKHKGTKDFSDSLHKKKEFSIWDFVSKCDQIRIFLRIWSHLLKKSLMESFIFCAVLWYEMG